MPGEAWRVEWAVHGIQFEGALYRKAAEHHGQEDSRTRQEAQIERQALETSGQEGFETRSVRMSKCPGIRGFFMRIRAAFQEQANMAKKAAEGLDDLLVEFMEWTRDNERFEQSAATLAGVDEELATQRVAAELEDDAPWTLDQIDMIREQFGLLLEKYAADTPLDSFV
jgi:hypothetical protein